MQYLAKSANASSGKIFSRSHEYFSRIDPRRRFHVASERARKEEQAKPEKIGQKEQTKKRERRFVRTRISSAKFPDFCLETRETWFQRERLTFLD